MHNCAFCKNPIKPLSEWKSNDGCFYCSEFCADAGEGIEPVVASRPPGFHRRSDAMSDDLSKKGVPDRRSC